MAAPHRGVAEWGRGGQSCGPPRRSGVSCGAPKRLSERAANAHPRHPLGLFSPLSLCSPASSPALLAHLPFPTPPLPPPPAAAFPNDTRAAALGSSGWLDAGCEAALTPMRARVIRNAYATSRNRARRTGFGVLSRRQKWSPRGLSDVRDAVDRSVKVAGERIMRSRNVSRACNAPLRTTQMQRMRREGFGREVRLPKEVGHAVAGSRGGG